MIEPFPQKNSGLNPASSARMTNDSHAECFSCTGDNQTWGRRDPSLLHG